jgi:hypothetical protein
VRQIAEYAAALAERRWPGCGGPAMTSAIREVYDALSNLPALGAAEVGGRCFPDRPLTIVPLALGLATLMKSAEDAILLAATIGGDSDSVASIAGGILGAMHPDTVNQGWYEVVEDVNGHGLMRIAGDLAQLRH